jgi:hypothetical protein
MFAVFAGNVMKTKKNAPRTFANADRRLGLAAQNLPVFVGIVKEVELVFA